MRPGRGPTTTCTPSVRATAVVEADTGRLEYVNRVRFWRYLTGDRPSTPTTG